jgi:hypothetical protein
MLSKTLRFVKDISRAFPVTHTEEITGERRDVCRVGRNEEKRQPES